MTLYALSVSRDLKNASSVGEYLNLPTPFQMSLLVGILVASAQQLRNYYRYLVRRNQRPGIPPVLHRTAFMMTLSFVLASGVFVADTVLHYTTSTIEIDQIPAPQPSSQELSRGISDFCLTFNRTMDGFPFSVEYGFVDPNATFEQAEAVRLAHNTSQLSEIRLASASSMPSADVAYLKPQAQTVAPNTDYRASTIGISTTCQFANPASCGMAVLGPTDIYTNFSCTGMFHGTLGIQPNTSEADGIRSPDAYRSLMLYKPASNLMYSFFVDPDMETIYNSVGLADNAEFNATLPLLNDGQLINPFYVALAARIPTSSFAAGSEMLATNDTFQGSANKFMDFIIDCSVSSYDISYTWADGALNSMSLELTSNGSVLEIFHGSVLYTSVSGQADSFDLQDFLIQAPISATTTESFLRKFAGLYSEKVLAKIGAYTTSRMALQEQQRQQMLLSKVPIPALGVLVGWSLAYTVLGLIIVLQAYRATRSNVRDIAAKLSLLGLSEAAFGESRSGLSSAFRTFQCKEYVEGGHRSHI